MKSFKKVYFSIFSLNSCLVFALKINLVKNDNEMRTLTRLIENVQNNFVTFWQIFKVFIFSEPNLTFPSEFSLILLLSLQSVIRLSYLSARHASYVQSNFQSNLNLQIHSCLPFCKRSPPKIVSFKSNRKKSWKAVQMFLNSCTYNSIS